MSNGTNHNPVASASASPLSGPSPLAVTFDGTGSTDQDNDTLSYAWNFGDSATRTGAIAYRHDGWLYTATLTVTDGKGGSDTDTVSISVGAPPTA
ncbi:MAG: PKD domain-containing protein [Betaproteobacteria bacterium]|nr:PKD domain-containing protein [Betaproteobacteria bacterium]